jgi:hypothetical protein
VQLRVLQALFGEADRVLVSGALQRQEELPYAIMRYRVFLLTVSNFTRHMLKKSNQ